MTIVPDCVLASSNDEGIPETSTYAQRKVLRDQMREYQKKIYALENKLGI